MSRLTRSPFDPAVFTARRDRYAALLSENKLDAFFVSAISDLYYLTGFMSEGYYGLFSRKGAWLFSSALLAGQVEENTRGCRLVVGKRLSLALEDIMRKQGFNNVAFDPEHVTYALGGVLSKKGLKARENPLAQIRIVKERGELECLKAACHLTAQSIEFIRPRLKIGVTEKQLAAHLEAFYHRKGAQRVAFDLIVAVGPHTALPHHVPGETRLAKNQPVIFDIGCTVGGYRSDLTRTIPFGTMKPEFRRIFNIVQSAQIAGMQEIRPGSTGGRVDGASRRVIFKAGYGRFFVHSTGHGVGIDIHEPPWVRAKSPDLLSPGMVLTVEPGIYLPGKYGVRIEDTLVVISGGSEILTK